MPRGSPVSNLQATTPVPDSKLRWPGWGSVSPKSGRQQQEAPKTIHTTMEGVLPSAELIKAAWRNSPTPTLMPLPQQRLQLFAVSTAPPSGLHIYTTGDEVVQSAAAVCSAAAQMLPQLLTSQQPRLTQLKAEASHVDVPVDVSHVARAEDNACAASHVKQDLQVSQPDVSTVTTTRQVQTVLAKLCGISAQANALQRESWAVDEDGRTPENWLCPLPLPQSQVEVSNAQGRCSLRSEGLRPVQSVLQRCSINDSVPSTGHPR